MREDLRALMARLRAEYLAEVPARLDRIRSEVEAAVALEPEAADRLGRTLHRLAGSAGAYGYGEVTALCREAEDRLAEAVGPEEAAFLRRLPEAIRAAFDRGPTTPPIAP